MRPDPLTDSQRRERTMAMLGSWGKAAADWYFNMLRQTEAEAYAADCGIVDALADNDANG